MRQIYKVKKTVYNTTAIFLFLKDNWMAIVASKYLCNTSQKKGGLIGLYICNIGHFLFFFL